MRAFFISIFIAFSAFKVQAQELRILNEEYNLPVSAVFVYNQNLSQSATSSEQGIVDLSVFDSGDTLFFQHPAFKARSVTYQQVVDEGTVLLKEKIIAFDEVVVAANKFEQTRADIAQDIISLKGKRLEFANPQTSADLLSSSGQVYVQKSQYGGGSPMLRGFAANSVLLVIDGVRLNNGIYRSGNLQNVINIDPNAVARTEVIFGPGSVMYGSDALGGVMDFTTKSPVYSTNDKPVLKGMGLIRYGTAANEKTGHFDFNYGRKNWSYFGSVTFSDFDDLRAGANRSGGYEGHFLRNYYVEREDGQDLLIENEDPDVQKFSGYDLLNTIHKISLRINEKQTLSYGFYYSTTSDIPRYDRLTISRTGSDTLENAEWFYGPQKWQMHALSLDSYQKTAWYDQAKANISFQDYQESRNDRDFGDNRLRTRTENVNIFTASLDFEKELPAGMIYYGVDGFYNDIRSDGIRENLSTGQVTPTASRYPDGGSTFSSAAAYASYRKPLGTKVKFTTGIRFNQVWLSADTKDMDAQVLALQNLNISNQAITGSAGLIFTPIEKRQINFLVSSGFRSPNVDDIGKLFELDNDIIVVPNPDLTPEYVYTAETGIREQINDNLQVEVVVYGSILNDAIVRDEYSINGESTITIDGELKQIRAQVNASRAYIYGGSFRLKTQFSESLGLLSVLSVNEGFEAEDREPLRHATPVFGQTSLNYQNEWLTVDLVGNYHFTKGPDNIPDSEFLDKPHLYTDEGTPGWFAMDLRTSFRLIKSFDIEAGVENIFDKHYRPYSSGISAPGRNIYVTAKYSF